MASKSLTLGLAANNWLKNKGAGLTKNQSRDLLDVQKMVKYNLSKNWSITASANQYFGSKSGPKTSGFFEGIAINLNY